jgi:uncharacterized RDD family membrane protein YckC
MSRTEVQARIDSREFSHNDLVWHEGLKQWAALSALSAFVLEKIPPPITKIDGGGVPTPAHFAGFWLRLIALLIDWFVCVVPAFAIGYVCGLVMYNQGATSKEGIEAMGNVLGVLVWWLYFASMESCLLQGTLRKLALGIKVTDMGGGRISFSRVTGRHFAKIVSAIILCIGFLMAAFTEKKQTLHDMMAGCLVIRR